mmetsp:Transcript_64688/g.140931  ORF Transcript_64688/g.140931 Transcript_64688/m.140931 type:complete len:203 (-) Transcript_64688:749-1357(-)
MAAPSSTMSCDRRMCAASSAAEASRASRSKRRSASVARFAPRPARKTAKRRRWSKYTAQARSARFVEAECCASCLARRRTLSTPGAWPRGQLGAAANVSSMSFGNSPGRASSILLRMWSLSRIAHHTEQVLAAKASGHLLFAFASFARAWAMPESCSTACCRPCFCFARACSGCSSRHSTARSARTTASTRCGNVAVAAAPC